MPASGQARVPGMGVVGLIAIDCFLIATEQTICRLGVRDRSIRHMDAANDGVACIHAGVDLVAEHALFAFPAPTSIAIRRWLGRRILPILARPARRIGPRRDQ